MPTSATISSKLTGPNLRETLVSFLLQQQWRSSLKLKNLKRIHSRVITCGLSHDSFLLTNLLFRSIPAKPRVDVAYTWSLLDQIGRPDIYLWNRIIQGISTSTDPDPQMGILFYARMRQNGVLPNKHTFPILLKALLHENPCQVYGHIVKFGLSDDRFVQNSVVSAFANGGCIDSARQVFDEITDKDVISWTAMIGGYSRNGRGVEALALFLEMKSTGIKVDEVTVVSVLCAAGMVGDVWFGMWVHGFYVVSGRVLWDAYVASALIGMYSSCGHCEDARRISEDSPYRNVVSWSALIAGFVQCSRYTDALIVFQDMLQENVDPNQSTLTSILTACAQLGALAKGKWVHEYLDANELKVNLKLGTALIDMYAKCGCIQEAFLVFTKISIKDVYIWTAMINALAMHGNAYSSLILFSQMLSDGVRPNGITFIAVLSACSHGGLVDEGRRLFGMMTEIYGLEPNIDHYGCMVDLLGRAGHFDEAVKLIEDMPMEPTPGVWGALFGACMIHKAYEFGEWIGQYLIDLQPLQSGRYALLANLYSSSQNWQAAANVRKLMKGKGVEKTRGCSLIELNGVIHEFIAFDKSHARSTTIYAILDSIGFQLKLAGFLSDTGQLMFDVD
ncbi:hypothetical protein RJ640_010089 [Escallonia rubra]|uniref:Pentatricopeptide repeat-containing protein n=1 Tax=Escallonia rubra TaxID=112253 RepID=A0AA88UD27_9ASTE|nr:hypothetical protein RJ640_010089 [Escallonia rubra]